jgi:membrane protease YdiL (CAAX protease family)
MNEESAPDEQGIETENRPKLWRWILGTVIILFSWLIIGSLLTILIAEFFNLDLEVLTAVDDEGLATLRGYAPWQSATAILISFIPLLVAPILLHRLLLQGKVKELFTRSGRSFAKEVQIGALVMLALIFGSSIPDFIFNNADYKWSFELGKFLPYLGIALLLIPMQTTAEEVFYRGWIQQRLEKGARSIWLVSTIGGLLFALPHLANPEVSGNIALPIIGYGSTGFMLTWVTMRDKSMGLAVGAHAANNLSAGLIVSSVDSALPAASLYVTPEVSWGPAAIVSLLFIPLFIWLTGKRSLLSITRLFRERA